MIGDAWTTRQQVLADTVSRVVEGEENSNDTFRSLFLHTGMRLKRAGVALARLDHEGHESGRSRGASAKADDVDVVWRLQATDDGLSLAKKAATHVLGRRAHRHRPRRPADAGITPGGNEVLMKAIAYRKAGTTPGTSAVGPLGPFSGTALDEALLPGGTNDGDHRGPLNGAMGPVPPSLEGDWSSPTEVTT